MTPSLRRFSFAPFITFATLATGATLFALPACDSDVGTGGSGGNGGGTGASGGGTGASGGGGACPIEEPQDGAACNVPSTLSCTYGTCCPPSYRCENGTWHVSLPPCAAPQECPATPPTMGDACDFCFQISPCVYDQCVPGMPGGLIGAVCTETGTWFTTNHDCDYTCGQMTCMPGEVCVAAAGGPGVSYSCQPDPCDPNPLSCGCAASLCGDPYECTGVTDLTVECTCATCP